MAGPNFRSLDVDGFEVFYREAGDPKRHAQVRFLDTGHFALETHAQEIAGAIAEFLKG